MCRPIRFSALSLTALCLTLWPAVAGAQTTFGAGLDTDVGAARRMPRWESLGPMPGAGTSIRQFAASPSLPDRVYAASWAGLLRSDDKGRTWQHRYSRPTGRVAVWVGVSPDDPDHLLCFFAREGLHLSTDGGLTFAPLASGPVGRIATPPTFARTDGSRVYVGTDDGAWRSDEAGDSFFQILDGTLLGTKLVRFVFSDPADEDHVYVVANDNTLFESTDGGTNWTSKSAPTTEYPLCGAIDPADGQRILLGTWSGIQETRDGGATWTSLGFWTSTPAVDMVVPDPADDDHILAFLRCDGWAETFDGGATWTLRTDPALETYGSGGSNAGWASSDLAGLFLIGGPNGIYRSADAGVTFERRNHGLEAHANVTAVAVSPFDTNHLVAKTGGSAYVSFDGGASWTESTAGPLFTSYDVEADPFVPGRFYIGDWCGGMWRSDDGGLTFTKSFVSSTVYSFYTAIHPTVPGRIFAAGPGLYRSDDSGATFASTSLPSGWVWTVEISAADPNRMYAGTSSNVYSSADGGVTWTAASPPTGLPRGLATDPTDPLRAWAMVPNRGTFRTDDGGATWTALSPFFFEASAGIVRAQGPGHLYTNEFISGSSLRSRVPGGPVHRTTAGLSSPIRSFTQTSTEVFAATYGNGVVRLVD